MAAGWIKGVQCRICLDCNDTVNKLFHKCFTIPEQITADLTSMTYLEKQVDLYLQRHELDWDFAGGPVPFCASKLTVVD